jgi:3-oxoacyl-[acyl-carrier-protein] synthase III
MAAFAIEALRLRAIVAAVPVQQVSTAQCALLSESQGRDFVRAVGIMSRRVAPSTLCASDLCIASAQALLDRTGVRSAEVGAVVFVTQTPDHPIPGNGALVQHRLGLPTTTVVLDLNQGCAGYVYGLAVIAGLMRATGIDKGLLLVGDTITRWLCPSDASTVPIFSDAGSATLVEQAPHAEPMYFNLGGDGRGADVIQVKGGGARHPFAASSLTMEEDERGIHRASVHLSMRGIDVLHFVMTHVEPNIRDLLAFAQADVDTPDYYVFHQANQILNDSLRRRLGITAARAPETLHDFGNTSCATIPVTICHRLGGPMAQGPVRLLLSGFGSGFSWGSALLRADSVLCPPLLELAGPNGG